MKHIRHNQYPRGCDFMSYLKGFFNFMRKRYLLIVTFSVIINGIFMVLVFTPIVVLMPVLYLYIASRMIRYYRESQEGPNQTRITVSNKLRITTHRALLMMGIYFFALVFTGLTLLTLVLFDVPIRIETSTPVGTLINIILVSIIPFSVAISIFSFVPYVIIDSSEDASARFILKKALNLIRRKYFLVLALRIISSVRYSIAVALIIIPFALLGSVFDPETGRLMFRVIFYIFLVVFFVAVPLYHGLMITLYEKAKQASLNQRTQDIQTHPDFQIE